MKDQRVLACYAYILDVLRDVIPFDERTDGIKEFLAERDPEHLFHESSNTNPIVYIHVKGLSEHLKEFDDSDWKRLVELLESHIEFLERITEQQIKIKCETAFLPPDANPKAVKQKNMNLSNLKFLFSYLFLLTIAIVVSVLIILHYDANDTSIVIEYNVGEIIAAILGGTGVALAGTAYATKNFKKENQ